MEFDPNAENGKGVRNFNSIRLIELPQLPNITGLLYEMFPGLPAKYSVCVATYNKLY